MAFILACSEQKTASLEGHEDIAAVIQKLPEIYDKPETAMGIYTDDALLVVETHKKGPVKLTGSKEIGDYIKGANVENKRGQPILKFN